MGKVEQPERNQDGSYTFVPDSKLVDILRVSVVFAIGLLGITFMMIRIYKLM